jgi:hypothetical protein
MGKQRTQNLYRVTLSRPLLFLAIFNKKNTNIQNIVGYELLIFIELFKRLITYFSEA